jgi:hypothetical protein
MFAILYSLDIHLLKKKPESAGGAVAHPATSVRTLMITTYLWTSRTVQKYGIRPLFLYRYYYYYYYYYYLFCSDFNKNHTVVHAAT